MFFLKRLFYYCVKGFLRFYTPFYFRNIRVFGMEHLPKDGGILLSPNHQGAFLDPLLIGAFVPGTLYSLTRGDVFVPPYRWIFSAMQMLPVFRIRNGFSSLKNNETTFEKCHQLLGTKKKLLMFSEGLHHQEHYLYPISKGSSRVACQAQLKHPDTPIYIVPVGINYQDYNRPWKGLHLVFGQAISVTTVVEKHPKKVAAINALRERLQIEMKKCLWIPENNPAYSHQVDLLKKLDTTNDFHSIRDTLAQANLPLQKKSTQTNAVQRIIVAFLKGVHIVPRLATRLSVSRFNDPIFHGSVRYAAGMLIFAPWFLFIFTIVSLITSVIIGIIGTALVIISLYLLLFIDDNN